MTEFERVYEIGEEEVEVVFEVDDKSISVENNGIGQYEFWGTKGFDKGRDYVSEFKIRKDSLTINKDGKYVKPSDDLQKKIEDAIYDDETINDSLLEMHEDRDNSDEIYERMRDRRDKD
jgi:hypothetical protein